MSTITYKGHQISTRIGEHGQETAFVTIDGSMRVFLRGLAEAKRFLRECAMPPRHGPRVASWKLEFSDSRGCALYNVRANMIRDLAYFRAEGRSGEPKVTRTEHCNYPGCEGGEIQEPGKRFWSARPCPQHTPPEDVVEGGWELLGAGGGPES